MSTKHLLRSFAGGEITPELAGRLDLTKYQTGLSLARNFITLPHGPAARRPGFEYINEAGNRAKKVRLIPFSFNAEQTAVLEFGEQYIRIHIEGSTLLSPGVGISTIVGPTVTTTAPHGFTTGAFVFIGNAYHQVTVTGASTFTTANTWGVPTTAFGITAAQIYAVSSPYLEADLFDLRFTQSADVLTITHPSYPTYELSRLNANEWSMAVVSFAPSLPPPPTPSLTVDGSAGTTDGQTYYYVATAVATDGITESLASGIVSGYNNLGKTGNSNTIGLTGVNGADRYNVYKRRGGSFGYIGQVRQTPSASVNITSIARSSDDRTVTVSTATAHGLSVGGFAAIANTGVPSFHGYWAVGTVVDADTFTYESNSKSFAVSSSGTVVTGALTLVDDNILPDTSQTPPESIITLNAEQVDYPTATTYHEQRRWFAGTVSKPQVVWATRTGTEKNLTSSIPSRDADAMEFRMASSQYNRIRHLVPLADLIALTAGGEFRIFAEGAPAITPTTLTIKPQGYSGASNTQPVVTSNSVLYVQAQGSRVRELSYNWESNAYRSVDASIMAPHRFNGYQITQLAYSRAPDQMLWAVRDDGTLMGLTYVPDQQVYGWHAHDTQGAFESVCVVAEGNEDVLYAVVRRTINGRTTRYIERLRSRMFTQAANAFFVDSGLIYDSNFATTTVQGLAHLEGCTVDVLADGAQHPPRVVTNGAITLDYPAFIVHVGLNIVADLRTLPLAMEGAQAAGQGTVKNVNKVSLRLSQSSVLQAGPSFDRLRTYPARAVSDPYGSPPALKDGEVELSIDASWNQDGAVCVRQSAPLPLTVLSMTLEVQTGG